MVRVGPLLEEISKTGEQLASLSEESRGDGISVRNYLKNVKVHRCCAIYQIISTQRSQYLLLVARPELARGMIHCTMYAVLPGMLHTTIQGPPLNALANFQQDNILVVYPDYLPVQSDGFG